MYQCDDFVFVHMFRMGGTTCINHTNSTKIGYHLPRELLPIQLSHLPVIGTIRNPYDWYVSVYQHCKNTLPDMQTQTFLNFMMDFKHSSMEDSLKRLLDPSWMTDRDIEVALSHFPAYYDYDDEKLDNLRKKEFLAYLDSGEGLLTWLFKYMFVVDGRVSDVKFCKLESLAQDFKRITSIDIGDSNLNSFDDAPGCGDILSDELKALIRKKDNKYIHIFYPELL